MHPLRFAKRHRFATGVAALVAVGVVAILIATLGASSESQSGNAAAGARHGGTLVVATEDSITGLAPPTAGPALGVLRVASNVYNSLVKLDLDGEPIPDLADAWTVSDDGRTYAFRLNERAVWHDGRPVTSSDVEHTVERLWPLSAPSAAWLRNIESVETPSDKELVLRLRRPDATLLPNLANPGTLVYPKHLWQGRDPLRNAEQNRAPVGSGPFMVRSFRPGGEVVLERNPRYFKPDLPYLDRIVVRYAPDATARQLAFESGDLDYLYVYLADPARARAYADDPDVEIVDDGFLAGTELVLAMNSHRGSQAMRDPDVRRAIAYAIDREAINELAYFGQGAVAHSPIAQSVPLATDEHDAYRQRDVRRAEELLDRAGYGRRDGTRMRLTLDTQAGLQDWSRAAQIIRENLAEVGIEVSVVSSDLPTYLDKVFAKHDFDLALRLQASGPDPGINLPQRYARATIGMPYTNPGGFVDERLEEIFATESAARPQERAALWDEAQRIVMDQLPGLPLVEVPTNAYVSSRFCDVIVTGMGYIDTMELAYEAGEDGCAPADVQ